MIHLLLIAEPRFLELDSEWVIKLLYAEQDVLGIKNCNCLMYLLRSNNLDGFNFNCTHF